MLNYIYRLVSTSKKVEGGYILNGWKKFITNAGYFNTKIFILLLILQNCKKIDRDLLIFWAKNVETK